jgi:hypothetical protein
MGILHRNVSDLSSDKQIIFAAAMYFFLSQDSSVGIATRYGLNGPGIESR